jgi:phospholipase C
MAQIEHIVVLMMENRSFDQMLGLMQGAVQSNAPKLAPC